MRPWQVNSEKIAAEAEIRHLSCLNNKEIEQAIKKIEAIPGGENDSFNGKFKPYKYDISYHFGNLTIKLKETTKEQHLKFLYNRLHSLKDGIYNIIKKLS